MADGPGRPAHDVAQVLLHQRLLAQDPQPQRHSPAVLDDRQAPLKQDTDGQDGKQHTQLAVVSEVRDDEREHEQLAEPNELKQHEL